jgi:hypothetical protein
MKLIFVILFEQFVCERTSSMVANISSPLPPDDFECYYPQVLMTYALSTIYLSKEYIYSHKK